MRALILGAAGQVGRSLVACAPAGTSVAAVDRQACDVTLDGQVERAIASAQPDVVINAAAYTAVDRAESQPELTDLINGEAPRRISAAARAVGARLVHISTDFVFDGATCRPYRTDDTTNPLGAYGRSKLAGERAVVQSLPDALIVRTAWVYAAHGNNFVKTMLQLMREREEISVVEDQIGTPTYAASLARALWRLADSSASGIVHFTDSGVASWYDFAEAIAEEGLAAGLLQRRVLIRPISTTKYLTPARRPMFSVLDKTATWDLLGAPAPHWRVNLRSALKELAHNG